MRYNDSIVTVGMLKTTLTMSNVASENIRDSTDANVCEKAVSKMATVVIHSNAKMYTHE